MQQPSLCTEQYSVPRFAAVCHIGVESAPVKSNIRIIQKKMDAEALKAYIKEAERAVDLAEREVKNRKLHLHSLQKQLQDAVIAGIGGMKVGAEVEQVKKPALRRMRREGRQK